MECNETNPKRTFKDSVFTLLFSEKDKLLELYNAVSGKNLPKNTEIEIITLSNVLFGKQLNDIAFVIENKLVVLMEHQSTVNNNMPLRALLYIAGEYEKIIDQKTLHRRKRLIIPTPEFIVLYNGREDVADYQEMRLSDAFRTQNESHHLELIVKVYNINQGKNLEMTERSQTLKGYEVFISEIHENLNAGIDLGSAIHKAIKLCTRGNYLLDFLKKHGSEVENMLLSDWKLEDALAVAKEEGFEDGEIAGLIQGRAEGEIQGELKKAREMAK
ncbi:MAG: Rpn family recombination-promoting nuclease/putative transposase, partial [Fibrobacter sp.]|nr:Rpn family recombination-promoting nuclease/putative transposase [Fibrobacter sp.]